MRHYLTFALIYQPVSRGLAFATPPNISTGKTLFGYDHMTSQILGCSVNLPLMWVRGAQLLATVTSKISRTCSRTYKDLFVAGGETLGTPVQMEYVLLRPQKLKTNKLFHF